MRNYILCVSYVHERDVKGNLETDLEPKLPQREERKYVLVL